MPTKTTAKGLVGLNNIRNKIDRAILADVRFKTKPSPAPTPENRYPYDPKPWCVDILCEADYIAVIRTDDERLVKIPFSIADDGSISLNDGQPEATESTTIYASEIVRYENTIKAAWAQLFGEESPVKAEQAQPEAQVIRASTAVMCAAAATDTLGAAKDWKLGESVEFMYMPAGIHTIVPSYNGKPIQLTVRCDNKSAEKVQASFEAWKTKYPKQTPFGCVEHREQEASVLPVSFTYKTEGDAGVYMAAEPTALGVQNVNGKIHRSWSPTFTTDADYGSALEKNGVLYFPAGVRGSATNPANITGVDFCVGTLTNKPAFKNMAPVKAKDMIDETIKASGTAEGAKKGWEHRFHVHIGSATHHYDSHLSAESHFTNLHKKAEFGDWEPAGENRERKLVWRNAKEAENDDGRKAVGEIIRHKVNASDEELLTPEKILARHTPAQISPEPAKPETAETILARLAAGRTGRST